MGKRSQPEARKASAAAEDRWAGLRCLAASRAPLLAVAFAAIATLRIAATYPVFNHTIDEPAHIACGMEWLAKGTYALEPQHPPLARIFSALGPFLAGERSRGRDDIYREGAAILYQSKHYERNLLLARLGTLPFFWLACWVLYKAAARWFGRAQAAIAVLLFTLTPTVLAHAALATTDMALTAGLGLSLYAILRWFEAGTIGAGVWMGLACAVALLSKFTALVFLPACLGLAVVWITLARGGVGWVKPALSTKHGISLAVAAAVLVAAMALGYRLTALPQLKAGLLQAWEHQAQGHPSYLLGERSNHGFVLFYPVAVAVKTPLGLLALAAAGAAMAWRKRKHEAFAVLLAFAAGMMLVGVGSRVNIGMRHLLALYFAVALLGAGLLWDWLERPSGKSRHAAAGLLLVAWISISGAWNHPDYIAYFNELALGEPEKILADSDLDWGQDMLRLSARLNELQAPMVSFNPFISAYLRDYHGFPPIEPNDPATPNPGWNAVSITVWKVMRMGLGDQEPAVRLWPDLARPKERVGRGVLLYYFQPLQNPRSR